MPINEQLSFTEVAVSADQADFTISFPYYEGVDEVSITVNDIGATEAGYTVVKLNATTFRLNPAVPAGKVVRLARKTDLDSNKYDYSAGALFTAETVDKNFEQVRHSQQETRDEVQHTFEQLAGVVSNFILEVEALDAYSDATRDIANTASSTANTALNTANTATSTANAALSSAGTAVTTANAANSTANTAKNTANTASANAVEALNTAATALSKANTASSNATTALNTANTASNTANNAMNIANSTSADTATALSTAQDAQQTANSLAGAIDNAVLIATTASETANGIAATANEALDIAEEARDAVQAPAMTSTEATEGTSTEPRVIAPNVLVSAIQYHSPSPPTFTGTAQAGLVPPRVGSVSTKYLREDGTWVTPTNTTYSTMTLALAQAGTSATTYVISPSILKQAIQYHAPIPAALTDAEVVAGTSTAAKTVTPVQLKTAATTFALPKTGGTVTGNVTLTGDLTIQSGSTERKIYMGPSGHYLYGKTGECGIYKDSSSSALSVKNTSVEVTGPFLATGNITAYSDQRIKSNITVIEDALEVVKALHGVKFNRTDIEDTDRRFVGLVAQDVQAVIPEAVTIQDDERGTLTVDYQGLVGLLVEAIKVLDQRVKELEAK